MSVHEPDNALEELSLDECRQLLRTQQVGRLGVIVAEYPLIFPLNYAMDGDVVVFRTASGEKLGAAQGTNVTFEVDELDPAHFTGWSVMIRGTAEEVTERHPGDLRERTQRVGPTPWAGGEHGHLVRIIPRHITGRRIHHGEGNPAIDLRGYV